VHALDAQYDTARQLPDGNVGAYFDRFVDESARARATVRADLGRRYGPHERETIDFFPAASPGAPLFFWIHGGYWRRMSKDAFSFVAPPLVDRGVAVAVVNYPLAPGPTLDEIVDSVNRGFAYALEHAAELHADPADVYLGGHSVGAQLAATVAARYPVRGLLTLSGLYDLEPLRATSINDAIAMDAPTAERNSPIRLPPLGEPWLVAAAGGREQSAFHEQQRAYVEAWRSWKHAAREVDAEEHNHFSIVLELADADSPISRALREGIRSQRVA
jgi:arylformamidase